MRETTKCPGGKSRVSVEGPSDEFAHQRRMAEALGALGVRPPRRTVGDDVGQRVERDARQGHVGVHVDFVGKGGVDERGRRGGAAQREAAGAEGADRVVELETHRLLLLVDDIRLTVPRTRHYLSDKKIPLFFKFCFC